jgi:hypothetical protein
LESGAGEWIFRGRGVDIQGPGSGYSGAGEWIFRGRGVDIQGPKIRLVFHGTLIFVEDLRPLDPMG